MSSSFYGLIAYILLFVFRPVDHIAGLKSFRITLVVSVIILLFVIISGKFKFPKGFVPYFIIIYFVLSFFSLINSPYSQFIYISITHLLKPTILYFLIFCVLDSEKKLVKFVKIFLYAIFVDIFVSVLMFSQGQLGYYRLTSFFSGIGADPNGYGTHILMVIPFLIFFIENDKSFFKKMLFISFTILCCYSVVRTYSRGSTIAAVVLCFMFVWLRRKNKKFIFIMIIFLIFLSLITPQKFWNRLDTITTDSSQADGSINARLSALDHGLELANDNLFFGVGFGAFRYASMQVAGFGEDTDHVAHNTFLEIGVETGLVNLIVFLMIILFSIRTCFLNAKTLGLCNASTELKNINKAILMALVIYCISVVFLSMRFDRFFYIVIALISSMQEIAFNIQNNMESKDIVKV